MVSGSSTIEFGTRNLALYSALSHRTVSRVLRILRDEPDPLIDLVSPRRMARADRYQLRIPDKYAASVRWRRRRSGRLEAAHPAFLVLGGASALVYQALDQAEARGAEVARAARLSASATSAALRVLAEYGLAERGPGGWRRGPADLANVAESTGAASLQREREERYKQDRESWRARLRTYQGARQLPVSARDGWWSLDDGDEYDEMCRWPVLSDDFVRGPPRASPRPADIGRLVGPAALRAGSGRPRAAPGPGIVRPVPLPRVLPGYPGSLGEHGIGGVPPGRVRDRFSLRRVQDLTGAAEADSRARYISRTWNDVPVTGSPELPRRTPVTASA